MLVASILFPCKFPFSWWVDCFPLGFHALADLEFRPDAVRLGVGRREPRALHRAPRQRARGHHHRQDHVAVVRVHDHQLRVDPASEY